MKILHFLNTKIYIARIEYLTTTLEKYFSRGLKDKDLHLRVFSAVPLILCTILILISYKNLNPKIPLWYTKPWGEKVLADRSHLLFVPLASLLLTSGIYTLAYLSKKFYFTYLAQILLIGAALFNTATLLCINRIIYVSSTVPLLLIKISNPMQNLIALLILGFAASYSLLPVFIKWATGNNLITDPNQHKHPGMILVKPSSRGGGFFFTVIFGILSLVFIENTQITVGIAVCAMLCGIIGLIDDFQNTNPVSRLKFFENPAVRLLIFLPIPVVIMTTFGIISGNINVPFGGNIDLSAVAVSFNHVSISPLPFLFTILWTLTIMNMISWSNGVDGQFGGVAGISMVILGLLAFRLVKVEPEQLNTAKLAFLAAGISFGFIPKTWHPSKIMWGFGAVSIGLLLSALSIVSQAKMATAIMIIMIPFLDGFITMIRRILQGKSPLKGDRGHLHHLLLNMGWSPKLVAVFYWVTTAVFGVIGLLTADKTYTPVAVILTGIVGTLIVTLNVAFLIKNKPKAIKQDIVQQQ